MSNALMTMTYQDSSKAICLKTYADTVVFDTVNGKKTLCAIRFGGYPEQVDGMMAAIHGGGKIELIAGEEKISLHPLTKQYRRQTSHDGVYAEAVLVAEDETHKENEKNQNQKGDDELEAQVEVDLPPRNSFIYISSGDEDALYEAIDHKTGVPMIPEFSEYIISELKHQKILMPLTTFSSSQKFEGWVLKCSRGDENIAKVVENGIKTGKIVIPNSTAVKAETTLDEINSVTEYLNTYGSSVAERIKKSFVPLFDPEKDQLSSEVLKINETIQEKAGYTLYGAQLAVAEAIKRQLKRKKVGLIVAECGAGKTKIGTTAIFAAISGLSRYQKIRKKAKSFNIILCPSHIKKKWIREIEETLPNTFAAIADNITELDKLYSTYKKGDKNCYVIISKEMARDGYMTMPAVQWNRRRNGFICPSCGEVVQMSISRDGTRYIVDADQFFFKKQNRENHKCTNEYCQKPLWTVVNPTIKRRSEWVKMSNYGFIYRPQAFQHLHKVKNPSFKEKLYQIIDHPENISTATGAYRKYPLSTYIKKHYKGRVDGLIVDELHEYNNDSGQGDAMAEIYRTAKKVVGMTGTLINGYSSGIFYLLYRIMPKLMVRDNKPFYNPNTFIAEYGVIENSYEIEEADYNANRRTVKKKKATRQLPGISPLLYSRFLLEYAAFLSLSDMGKDLPDYEEIPVPLHMPTEVAEQYYSMQETLVRFMRENKKAAKKILSAYMNLLTAYPDQPYNLPPILHPIVGEPIVVPRDVSDFDTLHPKDNETLSIVKRKIESGERVLIYTNWTRLDTQKKLLKLLTEAGYYAEILPVKIKPEKREKWVEDCVDKGVQVLITNPALVQTGLDLIDFTTIIFYDTGYKLFTLRQASRRSWRINQTHPRIEVYMLYYRNTMQHKAIKLMASKLAAAMLIEGGFSEEGLAAMYQCDDMTSQMAKELMLGIKDSVEDVSSAFKRMAFIKTKEVNSEKASVTTEYRAILKDPAPQTFLIKKSKNIKQNAVDENQLSFFDFQYIA